MDYVKYFVIGILLFAWSTVIESTPHILTSSCCSLATGSCRSTCEEISLVSLTINDDDRWRHLNKLADLCSEKLVPFWSCLNDTLQDVDKSQGFFGRPCCSLPMSQTCALVCLHAKTKEDLMQACRPSDETTFYACLDHQKAGQQCCEESRTTECRSACKEVFAATGTLTHQLKTYANEACAQDNSHVLQCVRNFTHTTTAENPSKSLHCCDASSDADCRMACRNILKTQTIGSEIVENLISAGCGMPMPHDKLWQCFLASADTMQPEPNVSSQLDHLGMDVAKLQCCFKASSIACQKLCIKTFSNEWEKYWEEFDQQCQYQPAESPMLQCLAEVDEPCELGCEGLSYCTNFNNRPAELFRNCNHQTDHAAKFDVELWQKGIIHMPMVDIPVLDISTCYPDLWKTVACALQIKPCQNKAHVNMICKSDCLKILSKCVDESRLLKGQTPETLCNVLSPQTNNKQCISLATYLDKVELTIGGADVGRPCKAGVCKTNEVCLVNRTCTSEESCNQHQCVTGCRMGVMSHMVVPRDTHVLIPRMSKGKQCYRTCYCNVNGVVEKCIAMSCLNKERCFVEGKEIAHGSQYKTNCTVCNCYDGELRCTETCNENYHPYLHTASGIICNCPHHYVPVCGDNGVTYSSSCIARCTGLRNGQFIPGLCTQNDPCANNPCGSKKKCLPKKQVCLSLKKKCPQYICVNSNVSCHRQVTNPVCDTEYKNHPTPCDLLQSGKQLAHYGKCIHNCLRSGQVCGHNGQTYISECAAKADRAFIDYRQACVFSFTRTQMLSDETSRCPGVQCAPIPYSYCPKIIPPGSCCPICGAVLKLVYSEKLLDRALEVIQSIHPALISALTDKLQEHVKTVECEVSIFYQAVDSTITAMIQPTTSQPTSLQVKACIKEAEKLQALIEQGSPTLLMELPLSSLIGAYIIHPKHVNLSISNRANVLLIVIALSWIKYMTTKH